jgi:phosphatidylserine/phosphatidylglycerophosphate/cardiolipin synthase-like enzyme
MSRSTAFKVPVLRSQMSCTITPPWFVDGSEYHPHQGTFKLLINGEAAFKAVYEAIEKAKKSVCVICWGFQPSMYFVRDGKSLMIGELLEQKARQGVRVRVLSWAFQFSDRLALNVTGFKVGDQGLGESNTPGRWNVGISDKPDTSTEKQQAFDERWYRIYDAKQSYAGEFNRAVLRKIGDDFPMDKLTFTSRSYSGDDKKLVASHTYADQGLTQETKDTLSGYPSHHQKMVLVDYEDSKLAVGFVMGHNMLDAYWDTSSHSMKGRPHNPSSGPNGVAPRQDFSSRITGPIIGDIFLNFAQAWKKETGEDLPKSDFAKYPLRPMDDDQPVQAQILRTQPQHGRFDIRDAYLQAVGNATQCIYIENQYFRWPVLAEKIKEAAAKQTAWGRKPDEHGSLYLFAITNSTDEGMGVGTINTYRMLDSLGRADAIPAVAQSEKADALDKKLQGNATQLYQVSRQGGPNGLGAHQQEYDKLRAERKQLLQEKKQLVEGKPQEVVKPEDRPGLKVHVCTIVAPDTKAGEPWVETYVHAKLMIIDDTFMTLGSANINTRSMESDSELNIAHHRPEISQPARKALWDLHTGKAAGERVADMPLPAAYKAWGKILDKNAFRNKSGGSPIAPLAEFLRMSPKRSNQD